MRIYHILIIVIGLGLLAACGSGSGGGHTPSGKIVVSCMDVNGDATAACAGTLVDTSTAPNKPGSMAAADAALSNTLTTYVFNGGDVTLDKAAFGNLTLLNDSLGVFNGVMVQPSFINGCGAGGFMTVNRVINATTSHKEAFGGWWCSNALEGPNSYTVMVYNGPVDMDTYAPTWNDMWDGDLNVSSWDWSIVNTDLYNEYGIKPIARGIVYYDYAP